MKTRTVLLVFIVLLVIFPAGHVKGAGTKEYKKFRLELYGGIALIDPSDLNQQAIYDEQYMTSSRADKYSFLYARYDKNHQYAGDLSGSFKRINMAIPFGIRLKYNVNRTIALSLGFQYISRNLAYDVDSNYGIYWINPDGLFFKQEYTDNFSFIDYTLSVKGYIPMLGIHFMTRRSSAISLEAFAAGGFLFAECSHSAGILARVVYPDGYWQGYDYFREMKGTGSGPALEAGVRFNVFIKKHFELFLEGSYSYITVKRISGSYADEYQQKDANAVSNAESSSWTGDWHMVQGGFYDYWSSFSDVYPIVSWGSNFTSAGDFNLDLSGIRLKVGIAYIF